MVTWRTTSQNWFWLGYDHKAHESKNKKYELKEGILDSHTYFPDLDALSTKMDSFIAHANEIQAEVKGIIPLTGSVAETYRRTHIQTATNALTNTHTNWGLGWAMGYGYGAAFTGGFLVILQTEEEISQKEYDARIEKIQNRRNMEGLEDDLKNAQTSLHDAQELLKPTQHLFDQTRSVDAKKKLLGGEQFICGDKIFKTHAEGVEYQDNAETDLERAKAAIVKIDIEITVLKTKISKIKASLN